jgi:DNA-binding CsgD family transcriptional regulator
MYRTVSEREKEVLRLLALGHTAAEAGELLCISPRTVEFHMSHAKRKLQSRNQTQAVVRALMYGLIPFAGFIKWGCLGKLNITYLLERLPPLS